MANSGNREYKSDLFSMLMQEKPYALETYNAVNNSDYKDPEAIEIITLDHGVSLTIRNDASFILDMTANYYEHQSSVNPNMPLRFLLYYAEDMKKWTDREKKNLFGRGKVLIPTPHFVVFYNGTEEIPDVSVSYLSDSFFKSADMPELELRCTVLNINPGHCANIMEKAKILSEYTFLVELVRAYLKEMSLEDAIHLAIDECINRGILGEFLTRRRNEVEKTMNLDFTFERQLELTARDEHEAGYNQGREEGIEEGIEKGIKKQSIQTEKERQRADAAEAEIKRLREELAKYKDKATDHLLK